VGFPLFLLTKNSAKKINSEFIDHIFTQPYNLARKKRVDLGIIFFINEIQQKEKK
jgi:hypothetical protein